MLRPVLTRLYIPALVLSLSLHVLTPQAQEPHPNDTAEGIRLYQQGDLSKAAEILAKVVKKHSDDTDAWYYLGLSYYKAGFVGFAKEPFIRVLEQRPGSADANAKLSYAFILGDEAVRAMTFAQRALELGDKSAEPHYAIAEASLRAKDYDTALKEAEKALKIDPHFSLAYVTMSLAHFNLHQNTESAADLVQLLSFNPEDPDAAVWRAQIEKLRAFTTKPDQPKESAMDQNRPLTGKEVGVKARVTSKPEPSYTEPARRAQVEGTVLLQCVFGGDGEVKNILVLKSLGFGLTSKSVEAAKNIKFTPAQKDGRAVSMYMHLEYNYHLY